MGTPHNSAEKGQIAKLVLMPGDPLRAKYIADTFLDEVVQFNGVRGMLGFTGKYKGKEISVMGSGMGMPSIGIYSYELYSQYGVESIIRIGSAGSYDKDVKVYDVVLATGAWSESSFALTQSGYTQNTAYPSEALNTAIENSATQLGIPMVKGIIHSSDVFYKEDKTPYFSNLREKYGCLCVEMESFALFHNASVLGKKAACLLTISDSLVTHEATSSEERQTAFTNMMEIALNSAI